MGPEQETATTLLRVVALGTHNVWSSSWSPRFPKCSSSTRGIVLGFEKRMGQLVDRRGRGIGCVPMDLWGAVDASSEASATDSNSGGPNPR